ncbi:hypothetical protein OIU79_006726 [Salix purpurea]|uniref:Uncharacterized protein n=1 Tax=Salix purpurea TaxID=77065 RepID=A0A9Q0Z2H4_SALPP|nr:hypothetical protein OIU79_006726 [Salix purpurea]
MTIREKRGNRSFASLSLSERLPVTTPPPTTEPAESQRTWFPTWKVTWEVQIVHPHRIILVMHPSIL